VAGAGGASLPFPRLSGDLCEVCPCETTSHIQPWGGQPTAVAGGSGRASEEGDGRGEEEEEERLEEGG